MKDRQKGLDALKGFLTILVVAGHVIGGLNNTGGYEQRAMEIFGGIRAGIYSFHMPSFIMLSGFILALSSTSQGVLLQKKIKNKIGNIICIYVIFSLAYGLTKVFFARWVNNGLVWEDLLWIPVKAIDLFWYLYVLAVFYAFVLLERYKNYKVKLLCCAVSAAVYSVFSMPWMEDITIFRCFYYAWFFLYGFELCRQKRHITGKFCAACAIVGLVRMAFQIFCAVSPKTLPMPRIVEGPVGLITAFCISNTLLYLFQRIKKGFHILTYLGRHCWELYTMHMFVTSGIRPVLRILHIESYMVSFVLGSILGILIPLTASVLLKKIKLWDLFYRPVYFFRQKILKKKQKVNI